MSRFQTTLGGICRVKNGGLALHFGVESALSLNLLLVAFCFPSQLRAGPVSEQNRASVVTSQAPEKQGETGDKQKHAYPSKEANADKSDPSALLKINLNTATAEQLAKALTGIGMKKAEAIVRYREQYGVFTSLEQLQEVPGIGPSFLKKNGSRVTL